MQTLEEMQQHYKAVRMRLGCYPSVPIPVKTVIKALQPVPMPEIVAEPPPIPVAKPNYMHIEMPFTPAQNILREVAKAHDVTVEMIQSHSHKMKIVKARQEAAYRMKTELLLSLPKIGRVMGKRDHTTILHAIRRYKRSNGIPE